MSHCKDCNDSILNGQVSLIPDPTCHDNCGSETACEGIQTYSDCVGVNPTLSCINKDSGSTLSEVLSALDTKLCQTQNSNCNVKISADDACCGFLNDKITSSSLNIQILTANPSNCQTIAIDTKCDVWNNVLPSSNTGTGRFRDKWSNVGGFSPYQVAQYTTVKDCEVKLRGTVTKALNADSCLNSVIMQLPFAPLAVRSFPTILQNTSTSCGTFKMGWILIDTFGNVTIKSEALNGNWLVSLDNITYQIN